MSDSQFIIKLSNRLYSSRCRSSINTCIDIGVGRNIPLIVEVTCLVDFRSKESQV